MKKMKGKRAAKKTEDHGEGKGSFFRPGDFNNKKRIGFPNLHLTIAAEAIKHADRARIGGDELASYFKDIDRVLAEAKKARHGTQLSNAMVAAINYCARILTVGESVALNETQALVGLDQVGQLVDLKQVRETFHTKVKRVVYAKLYPRAKRRGRAR